MTGRPQLAVGTSGAIRIYAERDGYQARTTYRDFDGRSYQVRRHGKTKGAAQRALAQAIRDRGRQTKNSTLAPESKVTALAEMWWATIEASQRSPGTLRLYRDRLDRQVIPSLGDLRLRELTVGVVDRHLKAVTATNGAAVAKAVRSVLSGMCTLACTYDALERNPVRDASPVSTKPKKKPRSLTTMAEVRQLRAMVTYDDKAIARDLPDFIDMMLATSLRVGEAAAIRWSSIDLHAGTIHVGDGIVVRARGEGLVIRSSDSSKLSPRTLLLPTWCVEMLERRCECRSESDIVFPAPKGGLRDPSNTSADLKDAFTAAGYEWMTSHSLRRTVATLMSKAGLMALEASDQLGHRRPSMTSDRYFDRSNYITSGARVLETLNEA
jgi:integrase